MGGGVGGGGFVSRSARVGVEAAALCEGDEVAELDVPARFLVLGGCFFLWLCGVGGEVKM